MAYEYEDFWKTIVEPAGYGDVRFDIDKCESISRMFVNWYSDKISNEGTSSSSELLWTVAQHLQRLGFEVARMPNIGAFVGEVVDELMMRQAAEELNADKAPSDKDIYPGARVIFHNHEEGATCNRCVTRYLSWEPTLED